MPNCSFTTLLVTILLASYNASGQFSSEAKFDSPINSIFLWKGKLWVNTTENGLYVTDTARTAWQKRWTLNYEKRLDGLGWEKRIVVNQVTPIGDSLFASTDFGLYASGDGGLSWPSSAQFTVQQPISQPLQVVGVAGSATQLVAILASHQTTYTLRAAAGSWSTPLPVPADGGAFRRIKYADNTWYYLSTRALYTSADGQSWSPTSFSLSAGTALDLAVQDGTILVGVYAETDTYARDSSRVMVYTSLNSGVHWQTDTLNTKLIQFSAQGVVSVNVAVADTFLICSAGAKVWHKTGTTTGWKMCQAGADPLWVPGRGWGAAEDGLAVVNNKLYGSFRFRLFSELTPRYGNLMARPLRELANTFFNAPTFPNTDESVPEFTRVSWLDNSTGETAFRIERGSQPGGPFSLVGQVPADSTSFNDTQIQAGQVYYYRVQAMRGNQASAYSTVIRSSRVPDCIQVHTFQMPRLLARPSADTVYMLLGNTLTKSIDGGNTWGIVNTCAGIDLSRATMSFRTGWSGNITVVNDGRNLLLKTTDGGQTWTTYPMKTPWSSSQAYPIGQSYFWTEQMGYVSVALDYSTKVARTTDGGRSITILPNCPNFSYVVLSSPTLIAGFTGSPRMLTFSSDAGQTWTSRPLPGSNQDRLQKLLIINSTTFYLLNYDFVSYSSASSEVYRTTDAGQTWQRADLPDYIRDWQAYYPTTALQDITFTDPNTGFLVGGRPRQFNGSSYVEAKSYAYRTRDGGQTWQLLPVPNLSSEQVILTKVSASGNRIVVVGSSLNGTIPSYGLSQVNRYMFTSNDGGDTWQTVCQLDYTQPSSITFRTPTEGYMLARRLGTEWPDDTTHYYKTTDRGITWTKYALPGAVQAFEIFFMNEHIGFIADRNAVWVTRDGGQSWLQKPTGIPIVLSQYDNRLFYTFTRYRQSYFLTEQSWLRIGLNNRIYRTDDAGATWRTLPTPMFVNLPQVSFITPLVGFVMGDEGNVGGQVYRTDDGGTTWRLIGHAATAGWGMGSSQTGDLRFVSATTGYAIAGNSGAAVAGAGNLKITRDGGQTWSQVNAIQYAYQISMLDSLNGVVGGVFRTADGGISWNQLWSTTTSGDYVWPVAVVDGHTSVSLNRLVRYGVPPCPIVTDQLPISLCIGSTISLSVPSLGPPTIKYQWFRNNLATPIAGHRSNNLNLRNARLTDAGNYFCRMLTDCGQAFSDVVSLSLTESNNTLQPGYWENGTIWSCGQPPVLGTTAILRHTVSLSPNSNPQAQQLRFESGGRLRQGWGNNVPIPIRLAPQPPR